MSERRLENLSGKILDSLEELEERIQNYLLSLANLERIENDAQKEVHNNVQEEISSLKKTSSNLKKAYLDILVKTDELETCFKEIELSKKNRKIIPTPPANSVIDLEEKKAKHFSQGLNFYKMFLLCFIGSFAGVLVETLWCFVNNGYIESRAGLVYGPFNLIYGIGAIALTATLFRYRNHNSIISFLGGFLVGSLIEYTCSWGQEFIFGSRSWDYSNLPFNVNGRICLMYSVFWGLLSVLWIKDIYPRMAALMLKISNSVGKVLTWMLLIFVFFNATTTVLAVYRWSQRNNGVQPSNSFEEFLDYRFKDERMSKIFVNMNFD